MSGVVIRGEGGPIAVRSMFGWILSGHTDIEESTDEFTSSNLIIESSDLMSMSPFDIHSESAELSNALQKFWDTESSGISEKTYLAQSDGHDFLKDLRFDEKEGRYKVCLPWKEGQFPASNEYKMCVKRLRQLHSRLKKNRELLRDYDNVIKDEVKTGIIEAVRENNRHDPAQTHFLPHHGVIQPDTGQPRNYVLCLMDQPKPISQPHLLTNV